MTFSTNTINNSIDFAGLARELIGNKSSAVTKKSAQTKAYYSDGSELAPTEAVARQKREGSRFLRRPDTAGATVDREGLTNNYAVLPQAYLAEFPSPEQARQYALQGGLAVLFVASLVFTAFAVS